jgi:hypothetical protein
LLSYGFAYTSIVARGFALAQALNILGIALLLSAMRHRNRQFRLSLVAGLAFGAAAFSNYLAVFIFVAAMLWLNLTPRGRRILPALALGFAAFLPGLLYFFRVQHDARIGQFVAFSLCHATLLLAKDFAASWFGGLPVYAGKSAGLVIFALILLAAACFVCIIRNWRAELLLFALCTLSVPAGLLALGILFDNTPIEIRYAAFALPYAALLLAATLPRICLYFLLIVEAAGVLGLIVAPSTMQPQAIAAAQLARLAKPSALLLLPFGNDGVGIPGPFIATAPDDQRIELVRPGTQPDLSRERTVILAVLDGDGSSKRSSTEILALLRADPCWVLQPSTKLLQIFSNYCGNSLSGH